MCLVCVLGVCVCVVVVVILYESLRLGNEIYFCDFFCEGLSHIREICLCV